MELVGYIAASVIGVSLGLIGGGGSILTLPVLVYLLHIEPLIATSYSLFIVGVTSSIGALIKAKRSVLSMGSIVAFGLPSMIMVLLTRRYIVPSIPTEVTLFTSIVFPKSTFILLLFSLLMIAVALNMILPRKQNDTTAEPTNSLKRNYFLLVIAGVLEGALSGLVGAGGGFLIIPVLVIFAQIPMKQAIATSLFIVGSKSLIGFGADLAHLQIDWPFLLTVTLITLFGFVVGHLYSKKMSSDKLKLLFGYFVLIMGVFVFSKELFL